MEDPLEFLLADIGRRAVSVRRKRESLKTCSQQWHEPWQKRARKEWQEHKQRREQALAAAEQELDEAIDAYFEVLKTHHTSARKDDA